MPSDRRSRRRRRRGSSDLCYPRRSLTGCGARRGAPKSRRQTMALFTDGAVGSIEDLRGHDTQLLNVAPVEGIDVTRKLALAQEELGIEVAGLLDGVTSPAVSEVAGLLGGLTAPPAIRQVAVTPHGRWSSGRTAK